MSRWKYFSEKEAFRLVDDLMFKLDRARDLYGFPIIITCGFRSPEHNTRVGGVPNSAHLTGKAADLRLPFCMFKRQKLMWALGRAGFDRIFIYTMHLHCDVDKTKASPAVGERQY